MSVTASQLHMLFNHFPVILSFTGCLFFAFGLFFRRKSAADTGLTLLVLAAVTALPALWTGEPAEHQLEKLNLGVSLSKEHIHEHEEAAEAAFFALLITGVGALGLKIASALTWATPRKTGWLLLLFALASAGMMGRAGHLGGMIRHAIELTP